MLIHCVMHPLWVPLVTCLAWCAIMHYDSQRASHVPFISNSLHWMLMWGYTYNRWSWICTVRMRIYRRTRALQWRKPPLWNPGYAPEIWNATVLWDSFETYTTHHTFICQCAELHTLSWAFAVHVYKCQWRVGGDGNPNSECISTLCLPLWPIAVTCRVTKPMHVYMHTLYRISETTTRSI